MAVVRETQAMIAGMTPILKAGTFVFCISADPLIVAAAAPAALCVFREDEGVAFVLDRTTALNLALDASLPMKWIVLEVFSALDGVGLTAAVATALAVDGIPCNMISAFHHDNVFVPEPMADRAMLLLKALQEQATP